MLKLRALLPSLLGVAVRPTLVTAARPAASAASITSWIATSPDTKASPPPYRRVPPPLEPLAVLGLTPAQFLANAGTTLHGPSLQKYAKDNNFEIKRGLLTPAEVLRIEAVVAAWAAKLDRTPSDLLAKRASSSAELDAFWTAVAEAAPMRLRSIVVETTRTLYDPRRRGVSRALGVWSKKEIETLIDSVAKHGPHWKLVSQEVGRTTSACKSKWRGLCAENNSGTWSVIEMGQLGEAVPLFRQDWVSVASFVGTRGPGQCRFKWISQQKHYRIHSRQNQDLVAAVAAQDALKLEEIDWEAIRVPPQSNALGVPQAPFTPSRLLRWWRRLISPLVEQGIKDHPAHVAWLVARGAPSPAELAEEGSDSEAVKLKVE